VGVALAFDLECLEKVLSLQGMRKTPCIYDDDDKASLIKDQIRISLADKARRQAAVAAATDPGTAHGLDKMLGATDFCDLGIFLSNSLTFKDKAFWRENEIRFISRFEGFPLHVSVELPAPPVSATKAFRARGSAVLPYLRVPLTLDPKRLEKIGMAEPQVRHPLVGVMIGPSAQPDTLYWFTMGDLQHWIGSISPEPGRYRKLQITWSQVPLRA
jgi:hypothetical protein